LLCYNFIVFAQDENTLYNKGLSLQQEREFAKAIAIFKKLEKQYPNSILVDSSLYMMGECYKELRDYNNALKSFQKIVNKYDKSDYYSDAFFMIGSIMYKIGHYEESRKKMNEFLKKFPDSPLIPKARDIINSTDNSGKVIYETMKLPAAKGISIALELLKKGLPERALEELLKASSPVWNEEIQLLKIICYSELKDNKDLKENILTFKREFPKSKWMNICNMLYNKYSKPDIRENIVADKYYLNIIDNYIKSNNYIKALDFIEKKANSNNEFLIEYKASILFFLEKKDKAIKTLESITSQNTDILMYTGYIFYIEEKYKKALELYKKAYTLSYNLKEKNNINRAINIVKRFIK